MRSDHKIYRPSKPAKRLFFYLSVDPVATRRSNALLLVMNSNAPKQIQRSDRHVLLGGSGGWNGRQTYGFLLFLTVLLAAPTQSGCTRSSGVGLQPASEPISHSVTLDWIASTSPVIGYNVHRGTASGGPYTLLNSSLVTTTQYQDYSVQSGQTFYYVVTSVDSSYGRAHSPTRRLQQFPAPRVPGERYFLCC